MRLIFFGTGSFAVPAMLALRNSIVLVVTQPDRPHGRGMRLQPSPMKLKALELGLAVESPEKSRSPDFVARLKAEAADALVVASYGQILSPSVLESATRGGINLHGSILPELRGAAPIQRSILRGAIETGVTLMQMDKGMDTGDIISILRTPIHPDETYSDLQGRLGEMAASLATDWLTNIVAGNYPRSPQNSSLATLAPKIERAEAEIELSRPAPDEYNRFRAFTDSPGAFLKTKLGQLRIHSARLSLSSGHPGEILAVKPYLTVACAVGALELREVQPEGKKRMLARDFANGARLKPGSGLIH
jgi:methionyl-tRNA formyltransferase